MLPGCAAGASAAGGGDPSAALKACAPHAGISARQRPEHARIARVEGDGRKARKLNDKFQISKQTHPGILRGETTNRAFERERRLNGAVFLDEK